MFIRLAKANSNLSTHHGSSTPLEMSWKWGAQKHSDRRDPWGWSAPNHRNQWGWSATKWKDELKMQKQLAALADKVAALTGTPKVIISETASGTPTGGNGGAPAGGGVAKPKVINSKGQEVEVTWICPCGQPHWSKTKASCVCCGKSRDDGAKWVSIPGEQRPADDSKAKYPGPLGKPSNLRCFQKLGFFLPEEAGLGKESLNPMDLDSGDGFPGGQHPTSELSPREKAIQTLRSLREMGAAGSIIKAAEAEVEAHPPPKTSQPIRDAARLQQILAQHIEGREKERAKQKSSIAALEKERDEIVARIAEEQEAYEKDEADADAITKECNKAIAKAHGRVKAQGPEDARQASLQTGPTKAQQLQQALAARLEKLEADPNWQPHMALLRKAFGDTVAEAALVEEPGGTPETKGGAAKSAGASEAAAAAEE